MTHSLVFYILAGIAGGIMGGMGLGGNLISFIPMSIFACIVHAKNKLLDLKKALLIALPAAATCAASSLLAQKVSADALSKGFAVFLVCLACLMLISRVLKAWKSLMSKIYKMLPQRFL